MVKNLGKVSLNPDYGDDHSVIIMIGRARSGPQVKHQYFGVLSVLN